MVSSNHRIIYSQDNCISPLGLESGKIKDEALSQRLSSYTSQPINIRLNKKVTWYPYGWLAEKGPDWLQVGTHGRGGGGGGEGGGIQVSTWY